MWSIRRSINKGYGLGARIFALAFFVALSQNAHAGLVDDLILSGTPYVDWRSNDPYLIGVQLKQNPGYWHHETLGGGVSMNSWVGDNPAAGEGPPIEPAMDGSKIPPYSSSNHWYQRLTIICCLTPIQSYLSLYPSYSYHYNTDKAADDGLLITPIHDVANLGVAVGGTAVKTADDWIYRYTIFNLGELDQSFDFILPESANHSGAHHEFNFLNGGGEFSRDTNIFGSSHPHNYGWLSISIAAGQAVQVGFSDVHGPDFAGWGVRTAGGAYSTSSNLLPVPSNPIPEPHVMLLVLTGLAACTGSSLSASALNTRRNLRARQAKRNTFSAPMPLPQRF